MKTKSKVRRALSMWLSLVMIVSNLAGLMPGMSLTAMAGDISVSYGSLIPTGEENEEELEAKQVYFNNIPWYIIEDDSATSGVITLLAAVYYDKWYYEFDKDNTTDDYMKSSVKADIDALTEDTQGDFFDVANAIVNRLDNGTDLGKLYLLSVEEAEKLPQNVLGSFGGAYWLRTAGNVIYDEYSAVYVDYDYETEEYRIFEGLCVNAYNYIRPALQLDLSKVTFDAAFNTFTVNSEYVPVHYSVSLTCGAGVKVDNQINLNQPKVYGAMKPVIFTVNKNICFFPKTDEIYGTKDGIMVSVSDDLKTITVSGTPTADINITIPDIVEMHGLPIEDCIEHGTQDDPWLIGKENASDVKAYLTGKYGDATLHISGTGAMDDFSNYVSPWLEYSKDDAITTIVIEEGITRLGQNAFENTFALTSVSIPDTVTSIGWWAFMNCNKLEHITIPAGVTNIGDRAFSICKSLKDVTFIPGEENATLKLGDAVFSYTDAVIKYGEGENRLYNGENVIAEGTVIKTVPVTYILKWKKTYNAENETPYSDYVPTGGESDLTEKQVTFYGKPWYVIEDNSVSANEGTLTLLAADDSFGLSKFSTDNSNIYSSSKIKADLDEMITNGAFKDAAGMIRDTDNGKLYLLSDKEADALPGNVRRTEFSGGDCQFGEWWLRTGGSQAGNAFYMYGDDSDDHNTAPVDHEYGVRPALQLDLSTVSFNKAVKKFKLNGYYDVILSGSDSTDIIGERYQPELNGDMTVVYYIAKANHYFPKSDPAYGTKDGITVVLSEDRRVISVYGTPTADVEITIPGADEIPRICVSGNGKGTWLNGKEWNTDTASNLMTCNKDCNFTVTYENVPASDEDYTFMFIDWADESYGAPSSDEIDMGKWYAVGKEQISFKLTETSDVTIIFDYDNKRFKIETEKVTKGFYADFIPSEDDDLVTLISKQVVFNGLNWYIIKDRSVSENSGSVTLLAAYENFGALQYSLDGTNDYTRSYVKWYLDLFTQDGYMFDAVSDVIKDTEYGKLYLLSASEANALPLNVRKIVFSGTDGWWLRSAGLYYGRALKVDGNDGEIEYDTGISASSIYGVRPALQLDLSKVNFTSVSVNGGANAIALSGTTQNIFTAENGQNSMNVMYFQANAGCVFPETSEYYKTTNGITISRYSDIYLTIQGTPTADTVITVPDALAPVSRNVTFKVVNGSWDDGTAADKTVTLNGYEGDTFKLAASDIPAAGSKPADGFMEGSWDVTPSAETEITADTIYTYTYAQQPVYFSVQFDMNGHGAQIPSQAVEYGAKLNKPAEPTAEGYIFGGWYTDKECTQAYDFDTKIEHGFTLYAKWTAEGMEETVSLNSISINTAPSKTEYIEGEKFDPAGMVVSANYTDGSSKEVKGYTYTPDGALRVSDNKITVSYTEGGITCSAEQPISVSANGGTEPETVSLNSISINTAPVKTEYKEGEKFDPTGMVVSANYTDGSSKEITGYSYTPDGALTVSDNKITVSYTEGGITCTVEQPISVSANGGGEIIIQPEDEDVWNLFESDAEHEYVIKGINVSENAVNSNAKSQKYYDAVLSGNTIRVSLKSGVNRKTAANKANSVLSFEMGNGSVVDYALPVEYVKLQFKLDRSAVTIKAGEETAVENTIYVRRGTKNYEALDLSDAEVKYCNEDVEVFEGGKISISADSAKKGKISVSKPGWENTINLGFSIRTTNKDKLSVDLGGAKKVILNTNVPEQSFNYNVYLNGKPAEDVTIDAKYADIASFADGVLTIACPKENIRTGNRTVVLKSGNASCRVKVTISKKALNKAVTLKIKNKYDVVTGEAMRIAPKFSNLSSEITGVAIDREDFTAELDENGYICVSYTGDALNAKKLEIGSMTFSLSISGVDKPLDVTLKNLKAKKTNPAVKAVNVSVQKDPAEGAIAVANIMCTYKDSSKVTHLIKPEKTELELRGVEASVNEDDPTLINIKGLSKNSGKITAKLTFKGGVTKTVKIIVKKAK